jgi:mono/diheme cytochrome c family protein
MKNQMLFAIVLAGPLALGLSAQAGPAPRAAGFSPQAEPAPRTPAAGQQAAPAPQQQNAPAGNAANGRKLFVSFGCYQCHGYEAQGGSAGPRLAPRPIAYAQFMKYVRHPTNEMPPFTEKIVKDSELNDIHAFLRAQPAPPDVDKIPLLK